MAGSAQPVPTTFYGASQQVGKAVTVELIEERLGQSSTEMPGVDVRPRVWYNPNMESSYFIIPGLMVIVLFMFTTLFTSTAIVRERELGTIEQLIVTPIRPTELIIAKVIPMALVSFVIVIEMLVLGVVVFGVPIQGSIPLLLGLSGLFLLTALGLGILLSSAASTQTEALLMTLATVLPTIFLSGFFFPLEAMPGWLQAISYLIPARYAMTIMRGIILKGVGLQILIEQVIAVLIFSAAMVLLASTRFKKNLE